MFKYHCYTILVISMLIVIFIFVILAQIVPNILTKVGHHCSKVSSTQTLKNNQMKLKVNFLHFDCFSDKRFRINEDNKGRNTSN